MDLSRIVNRNRFPRWINALIDKIADSPDTPIGRLVARRMGAPAPVGSIAATQFDDRPIRVLIAPVNYSGQGTAWARALEAADPDISARNMAIDVPGGFSFAADLVVPVGTYHNDPDWQHRQLRAALQATHLLIEAEEPPFGRLLGRSVTAQAEALRSGGVNVAFLAHGTDVRLPSRHRTQNPWSHYDDPEIYAPRDETVAQRNIDLLTGCGRPVFVSTPDLLVDLPYATWCPVSVDPDRWCGPARTARRGPLRVAHAPSVGPIKGTNLILPTLERLVDEGVIVLDLIRGVPSAQVPARFAAADVVIDQMRIGSYGVAACEAMAAGCTVIGHVSAPVRALVRETTGLTLPIVEATAESIETVLRELSARADLTRMGAAATTFVRTVHDGRWAAQALLSTWIRPSCHDQEDIPHASRT